MRIGIMQSYFFPYIGYFQAIHAVDQYHLYEHFNYIKDGWMHRNRIQGSNKSPFYFSVPVTGRSSHRRISEIKLVEGSFWRRKLKTALTLNYRAAPFFEETYAVVEPLLENQLPTLHEYNSAIIRGICNHLNIQTRIVSEHTHYLELETALEQRNESAVAGDEPSKKVHRVLQICLEEEATTFVNAIGGAELYDKAQFAEAGVDLRFVKTLPVSYQQSGDEFQPNLSILDVLMFCGREGAGQLLKQYELV